jgi:hypothetical protein
MSPKFLSRGRCIAIVFVLMAVTPVAAQSTFGSLVGTVTDPSGAVVPGATVEVTSTLTQALRATVTDGEGAYLVSNLDAGTYRVSVTLTGFSESVQEVMLLARQTLRVDSRLQMVGASEQIVVSAAPSLIETSSATINNSRSGDDISRLALNFRATSSTSPIVVATLAPGVQQDRAGAISIAGNMPFMTSFSIDGIASHSSRSGGPAREMFPSIESIEEFKVSSANNNAEFMQVTDITTTSKSGSNQFRGTGFWFLNDSKFSSVDRFVPKNAAGEPIKPAIRTNSFGLSGGGPILRNRTFFFGTFEGVRQPSEVTLQHIVPPAAFRAGDLSSLSTVIRNPVTGQPFPGNQIPVNVASAKILSSMYELPNLNTGAAINRPNYVVNEPADYTQNGFDVRGDQRLSDRQRFFVRLTFKDLVKDSYGANAKLGKYTTSTDVRQLAGSHNLILSGSLLNEFRTGFAYNRAARTYPLATQGAQLLRDFGFLGLPPTPESGGVPFFEFADGSFITTGGDKPTNVLSRSLQVSDNVTWVKGHHTIKGGIDIQRVEYRDQSSFFSGDDYGSYTFTGQFSGNAFADFLLGLPANTRYAQNPPDARPYTTQFAGYVQDDWRATPKMTVNYGLRYDLRPPYLDRGNQLANFDRNFPGGRIIVANDAAKALIPQSVKSAVPNTPIVTAAEVGLSERLRKTDKNNFNPRIGVAYRPFEDQKTVLRGGYGLYTVPLYGTTSYSMYASATGDVPSFQNRQNANGTFAIQFPNVFPQALRGIPGAGTQDFRRANQVDLRDPTTQQWTATVERELGWSAGLRVSYVGSSTKDLVYSPDLNQVRSNTSGYAAVRDQRPFKDWNVVTTRDNGARARYDGLTFDLTKRVTKGFSFSSSYTLARHKSDAAGAVPTAFAAENGASTLNIFRGDADYGPVAYTRRHRSVSTFFYSLPFRSGSRGMDALVGGWELTGVLLLQSGSFETAQFSNRDPSGTGATVRGFTSTQRPDQVGDGNLSSPSPDRYWDVAAFVLPANNIGRFGNGEVGTLIGPGTKVFSMTIGKNVRLATTQRLRFEIAISNLFDIENFDVPIRTITSPAFGRVTATQTVDQAGPRTVQFSLRFTF